MPPMPCAQPVSRPKPAGAAPRAAPGRRRAQGYTPPPPARRSTRKNDAFTSVKSLKNELPKWHELRMVEPLSPDSRPRRLVDDGRHLNPSSLDPLSAYQR